ncbi:MAG: twin-arginine translocase TatA/TatE family subunit [Candidatus Eremiobacteraeota bacterium]|nr:twin-arginine translocase TatA/TatE family subunit [Candidatus Eremiobacteraeota bacterium]
MQFVSVLAFIDPPIIIGIVLLGALLFGADKLPKLARSAGQAKKEFLVGQAEADAAAAQAREDARVRADYAKRDPMDGVSQSTGVGQAVPPPMTDEGTQSR